MDDLAYWIAFNRVPGIGPTRLTALLNACGSISAAWKASIQTMQAAGLDRRSIKNLLAARQQLDLQAELDQVITQGYHAYSWDDDGYPANLRRLQQAPPLLYARGKLKQEDELAVAVVGTRRVSPYGQEVARELGSALGRHGVTVISGLALGVDAIAHEAALDAGGRTVAVLGSSVDIIYPSRNHHLGLRIIEKGALVSEYPLSTRPEASNFPPRNRIISGMSLAVVVVEAAKRSGALITARFAGEQGRDVFAVPGSILSPGSDGCNRLIQEGAIPVTSIRDLLERLQLATVAAHQEVRVSVPASPTEQLILKHITTEPQHMNEIARSAPLEISQVSSLLAMMELKGLVRQVGPMQYVRSF
jgi:DNA processing protein